MLSPVVTLPSVDDQWRNHCQINFGVPARVDLRSLARHNGSVCGVFAVTRLRRLVQDLPRQVSVTCTEEIGSDGLGVVWFELRAEHHLGRRDRAYLKIQSIVTLTCQRCVQEMAYLVDEEVEFELFASEAQFSAVHRLEELDPDAPEPLVASEPVDLLALIEDQMILAIPYVPKHEHCEAIQGYADTLIEPESSDSTESAVELAKKASPFDVLANFKRDPTQ
jgi:uncharacterized protein